MEKLNLKPTHKPVKDYYKALEQYNHLDLTHEGTVSNPFAILLDVCAKKVNATFAPQYPMRTAAGNNIFIDGAIISEYRLPLAYWEAKDMDDDLSTAIQEKRDKGYPFNNILFQNPERAILIQNKQEVLNTDITDPENLVKSLQYLFSYSDTTFRDWYDAVDKFRDRIPALANKLKELIAEQHKTNTAYKEVFAKFYQTCQLSINPDLSQAAVEEMLIQHILTERIFRKVFDFSDFANKNIIAVEIEKVSAALMQHAMSRDEFLKPLNPFYDAIEGAASVCTDFSQKQHFLNTVYERFFQGFCIKIADTHGIVYTPQPVVDFMVNSVEYLLQEKFNRSLSDTGVHIIDPFVGTGNFIVRIMKDIRKTALEKKYRSELHCNENLLLPYYIANLNIEQEYMQHMGTYLSFKGIVFADTFELFDQAQMALLSEENTKRVEQQRITDMFVVIGNPPYNARQESENDNNKNREYKALDKQIKDTYVTDSNAQLMYNVYDPYVRAFSWATKRIKGNGIVAFVTNNTFIDGIAFDGMRKHLAKEFNALYLFNLGGNILKGQPPDSNVFDIKIGVSIALLVKTGEPIDTPCIFYNNETELKSKANTFNFLKKHHNISKVTWEKIQPDAKNTWLTEELQDDFDDLIPMGTKAAKKIKGPVVNGVIFRKYSLGVSTNRDVWVYNFSQDSLCDNVKHTIGTYNAEVDRWKRQVIEWKRGNVTEPKVDDFVLYDDTKIKWSRDLKRKLKQERNAEYIHHKIRKSLYRPFTKSYLYLDRTMTDIVSLFHTIFPTPGVETENQVICINITPEKPFTCLITDCIPNLVVTGGYGSPTQCFPFYTYNESGNNRRENITDWALRAFQNHYRDNNITKWDIFYYNYGILHHPDYRSKYGEDLKRSFPRITFTDNFWTFAKAGKKLADLHVNYESVSKYEGITLNENPDTPLNWKVEKMKLSKDKTQIEYNNFLTINDIPAETHEYKLGSRSALEWIVDQYRVKIDARSKIRNDPNREDEQEYIVDLIARVITVSLETVKLIDGLPALYPEGEN